MKLSRRGILALAGTGAALAQAPAPVQAPPTPPADPLDKARQDNRRSAEKLTSFQLAMSTEPAFVFRP